jgi:hypothetical protein
MRVVFLFIQEKVIRKKSFGKGKEEKGKYSAVIAIVRVVSA